MFKELATLETYGFVYISSEGQKVCLYCVYVEMEWLYGSPERGDSEALATWTSVRISFAAPFLLFACMICFNFVIACWLYCFNVDVFVGFFCVFFLCFYIFGKKLLRAYVFCLYYMPNWNKVLLTYLLTSRWNQRLIFVFYASPLWGIRAKKDWFLESW